MSINVTEQIFLSEIKTEMRKRGCLIKQSCHNDYIEFSDSHKIYINNEGLFELKSEYSRDIINIEPNSDPIDVLVALYDLHYRNILEKEKTLLIYSILSSVVICMINHFCFGWEPLMLLGAIPIIIFIVINCSNYFCINFYKVFKKLCQW